MAPSSFKLEAASLQELFSSINRLSDPPDLDLFPQFLSSFTIPTTQETIEVKAAIQESLEQRSFIEKILLKMEIIRKDLELRLRDHCIFQSKAPGVLSSFKLKLLPPELLSHIFFMCLPEKPATFRTIDPPWSIARVCRKWRQVSHSTPSLWAHIINIYLDSNHDYGPGFFELLRTVMELSFPRTVGLVLRGSDPDRIQDFVHILPRVHSLNVSITRPWIDALAQMKESFSALKSAKLFLFKRSTSKPRCRLDFLSKVSDLSLLCHQPSDDVAPAYGFLKLIDFQWPNLTSFHGAFLPAGFLSCLLSSAPLLQKVTIEGMVDAHFCPSTHPIIQHRNLKDLHLTICQDNFPTLSVQLPALQRLRLVQGPSSQVPLSLLQLTHGSIVELYLAQPLRPFEHQRAFYSLCPRLEQLTLCQATGKDLETLTNLTNITGMPCPALRRLFLKYFHPGSGDEAHILRDFLSSRGLMPFCVPHLPPNCRHRLESVSVKLSDNPHESGFFRHLFEFNGDTMEAVHRFKQAVKPIWRRTDLSAWKEVLEKVDEAIRLRTPSFLFFLEDFGVIERIQAIQTCTNEGRDPVIRDLAKKVYEGWVNRSEETRGLFPQWKRVTTKRSRTYKYILSSLKVPTS